MINLQNHIYLRRKDWSNQKAPMSNYDTTIPQSNRPYWGWNEIPVSRETISNKQLRDAVVVKLLLPFVGVMAETTVCPASVTVKQKTLKAILTFGSSKDS